MNHFVFFLGIFKDCTYLVDDILFRQINGQKQRPNKFLWMLWFDEKLCLMYLLPIISSTDCSSTYPWVVSPLHLMPLFFSYSLLGPWIAKICCCSCISDENHDGKWSSHHIYLYTYSLNEKKNYMVLEELEKMLQCII